eukprot:494314-Hanusia_phi.AAC.2
MAPQQTLALTYWMFSTSPHRQCPAPGLSSVHGAEDICAGKIQHGGRTGSADSPTNHPSEGSQKGKSFGRACQTLLDTVSSYTGLSFLPTMTK